MKAHIWLCTAVTAAVLMLSLSANALATPGVAMSLGEGFTVGEGDTQRTDFNIEALAYWGFGIVHADLGVVFNIENPDSDIVIRPGARVFIPGLFYARAAFPIAMNSDADWGMMFGVGKNVFNLAALKLFVEVDATFYEKLDFTDVVPIEARIGVEIGF